MGGIDVALSKIEIELFFLFMKIGLLTIGIA